MLRLAAFADEISPDLDAQIEHCRKNGVTHIELRGVAGKNVLDFDKPLRAEIKRKLTNNGLAVACIGSPIGKVKLNESFDAHFERFKTAVELADYFGAPLIRIFSYYPAEGETREDLVKRHRDEVLRRLQKKVDYIKDTELILAHENEANIYGEKGANCLDLLKTINSPQFRAVFDFANFVLAGEDTLVLWPMLKPYTVHFHIKDAQTHSKKIVPSGEGDGHLAEILKDAYLSGYRGFLSLEPHLAAAGKLAGFSGPDLFATAVNALRNLARANDIPLAS